MDVVISPNPIQAQDYFAWVELQGALQHDAHAVRSCSCAQSILVWSKCIFDFGAKSLGECAGHEPTQQVPGNDAPYASDNKDTFSSIIRFQ